jgi:hypothetical protein
MYFFSVQASLTTMDRKTYTFKRRITSSAVSNSAVKDLQEVNVQNLRLLCTDLSKYAGHIEGDWGKSHDMTKGILDLLSDVMEDVTFFRNWLVIRN